MQGLSDGPAEANVCKWKTIKITQHPNERQGNNPHVETSACIEFSSSTASSTTLTDRWGLSFQTYKAKKILVRQIPNLR